MTTQADTIRSFREVWFPQSVRHISVVAPPADDDLPDARLDSPNYTSFDRLGDRDSVYAVGIMLSKHYPRASVAVLPSGDFEALSLKDNFVIIGGPGVYVADSDVWLYGNSAARRFAERTLSRLRYSGDAESATTPLGTYRARYDSSGRMLEDYGGLAAFPNPFDRRCKIVMIHGIHTLGVLGAARLLDGSLDSWNNLRAIGDWKRENGGAANGFECFVRVEVLNGQVACPELDLNWCWALGESRAVAASRDRAASAAAGPAQELRDIVTVAYQDAPLAKHTHLQGLLRRLGERDLDPRALEEALGLARENPAIPISAARRIAEVLGE